MEKGKITFHDLFYIFLFGCVFGWITEGIWTLLKKGLLVNHSALIIGPFNVVYGIGAMILTLVLYKLKDNGKFQIFCVSFFTGSILEYFISYFMELVFGFVAWNYKSKPFNLNGRICLMYSVFWGILGLIWIKKIYPFVEKQLKKLKKDQSTFLMKIIIVFLIIDAILTVGAIHRGKEFEKGIEPQNKIEEIYDKYFGVEYLNNMFNYRWNKK